MTMDNSPLQPGPVSLPQPVGDKSSVSAPQPQEVQQPVTPPSPQQLVTPSPQQPIAHDADDLAPEWLHMVDSLVRQNIQDPRKLSQEFEKVKAQYIAGRYGKEIKQSGEKG